MKQADWLWYWGTQHTSNESPALSPRFCDGLVKLALAESLHQQPGYSDHSSVG